MTHQMSSHIESTSSGSRLDLCLPGEQLERPFDSRPQRSSEVWCTLCAGCKTTFMEEVIQTLTKHLLKLGDRIREDICEELRASQCQMSNSLSTMSPQDSKDGSRCKPAWQPILSDQSVPTKRVEPAQINQSDAGARRESVVNDFLNFGKKRSSLLDRSISRDAIEKDRTRPRKSLSNIAQKLDTIIQSLSQTGKTSKASRRLSTASHSEETKEAKHVLTPPKTPPNLPPRLGQENNIEEHPWNSVVAMPDETHIPVSSSRAGFGVEEPCNELAVEEYQSQQDSTRTDGDLPGDLPIEDYLNMDTVNLNTRSLNWGTSSINMATASINMGTASTMTTDLHGFKKLKRSATSAHINHAGLTSVSACMAAMHKADNVTFSPADSESGSPRSVPWGSSKNASARSSVVSSGNLENAKVSDSRGRRSGLSGISRQPTMDLRSTTRLQRFSDDIFFIVGHERFNYFMGAVILVNAAIIGMQIDYMAQHTTKVIPDSFRAMEVIFCIIYSVELILRIYVQRKDFFIGSAWRWNSFDMFLVTSQLTEELLGAIEPDQDTHSTFFGVMRGMRILRLLRIFRVVSVLRPIAELNMIMKAIEGSLRSLFWTIVLLFFIIYVLGAYLTSLVSDHKVNNKNRTRSQNEADMQEYFGGVLRSIFTLYQAMTGGIDWDFLTSPLMEHISPWLGLLFSFYIAFSVLALMNIVTGVFVQSAITDARESNEEELVALMQTEFKAIDISHTGLVSLEEFEAHMSNSSMRTYLKKLNLDVMEAMDLFHILDSDGSGDVSYDEFATGCLKLRRQAKALDLVALMQDSRRSLDGLDSFLSEMAAEIISRLQRIEARFSEKEQT